MKTPKLPPQTRLHSCHDGRSPQGGKSDDDLLGQCEASSAVKYHDEGPYLSKGSLCGKIWAAGRSIIMILMAVLMTGFAVNAFVRTCVSHISFFFMTYLVSYICFLFPIFLVAFMNLSKPSRRFHVSISPIRHLNLTCLSEIKLHSTI